MAVASDSKVLTLSQRSTSPASTRQTCIFRNSTRNRVARLLEQADIRLNGTDPWDLRVSDERFFARVLAHGSLGLGESYMDGWWEADSIDEFVARIQRAELWRHFGSFHDVVLALTSRILNAQSAARSRRVAARHYDLGDELYEAMLGRRMQYTCAYWRNANTLDQAQEDKLDLIARKLHVERGCSVLDLGCGLGGLAQFLAAEYGCHVVAYNISHAQVEYGRGLCRGLPVRFEERDYREARREADQFDRVAAVGICEHIGAKNYRSFLELAHHCLRPGGLFLLHTIGANCSASCTDAWIDRYIFPGGMMPSVAQLGTAMEGLWTVEDWHNFGPDYDRTLLAWWRNVDEAWPELKQRFPDRFYRMWKFYLLSCAGSFRARKLQLWQIVLSRGDVLSYTPVR